jgi:hypothetical protein
MGQMQPRRAHMEVAVEHTKAVEAHGRQQLKDPLRRYERKPSLLLNPILSCPRHRLYWHRGARCGFGAVFLRPAGPKEAPTRQGRQSQPVCCLHWQIR